jgi:hypothetical protein
MRHASISVSGWFVLASMTELMGCSYNAPEATEGLPLIGPILELHQINVGWGSSVFLLGPDGTKVLLDAAGNVSAPSNVATATAR